MNPDDYMGYISPYFVISKGKFTKYYFEGAGRIVSKLGNGSFAQPLKLTAGGVNYGKLTAEQQKALDNYVKTLGVPPGPPTQQGIYATPEFTGDPYPSEVIKPVEENQEPPEGCPRNPIFNAPGDVPGTPVQFGPPVEPETVKPAEGFTGIGLPENDIFYFHPDHLGSTSYITTKNGSISQYVEYIAFGEVLFEEHSSSFSSPYLFNGKELDRETNLSYYGARYLDMKTSLWLNVDPLVEEYPNIGCYTYVSNNPINIIDPDGKFLLDVHQRILSNALKGFNINFVKNYSSSLRSIIRNNHLNSAFKFGIRGNGEIISGGITFPDLHQTHTKSAHFDQMNFSQISSNFDAITQATKVAVNNFKNSNDYFKGNILGFEVGKNLHGIADFYSHSNYIELYESIYGQTSIKSIPTISGCYE